ncbi:MAG: hypothetical protein ACTSQY_05430 [Candidatus Odinarchaeia archaeon]
MAVTMERQAVRATISFGDITVETPDVVSFNVRRARGQMCATFTASVKILSTRLSDSRDVLDAELVIKAGFKGNERTIFTGKIFKATVNPIRTDASKVMLSLSGKDVLHVMEGQKINRRVKTYRDGEKPPERWGLINNITKDNSIMRASLPPKVTSHTPKVVRELNFPGITYVEALYGKSLGIESKEVDPIGSISTEVLPEEEE